MRVPRPDRQQILLIALIVICTGMVVTILVYSLMLRSGASAPPATVTESDSGSSKTAAARTEPTIKSKTIPAPPTVKTQPAPLPATKPFKFGVGVELDSAMEARITKEAPIRILASWFNKPSDLGFMEGWKTTRVPQAYAKGYDLQLVIYAPDDEVNLTTKYGPACGRPYPLSDSFLSDMQRLAATFGAPAGGRSLYVTMFTEFQTYPCSDNNWAGSENYYRALQDQYMAAKDIFHQHAPNSKVALSWGGWQANWDDPGKGGGSSLFKHFAHAMNTSDFQSFQSMSTTQNLPILQKMTKALHGYGNGQVMVSHYKPDNGSQPVFDADMGTIFTASNVAALQADGLFAFTFMDTVNMNSSEAAYQRVKGVVQTYAQ